MMKNQVILCDLDNTIADTNSEIQKRLPEFHAGIYPFPLPPSFFDNNPEIFLDAEPFVGASFMLNKWVKDGSKLFYVTARAEWTKKATEFWLRKHGFPNAPVVFTPDKRTVAAEIKATIGFEDSPGELDRLLDVIPNMFVHAMVYNQTYSNRFSQWEKIAI